MTVEPPMWVSGSTRQIPFHFFLTEPRHGMLRECSLDLDSPTDVSVMWDTLHHQSEKKYDGSYHRKILAIVDVSLVGSHHIFFTLQQFDLQTDLENLPLCR